MSPGPSLVLDDAALQPRVVNASSVLMTEVADAEASLVLTGPPYFSASTQALLSSDQTPGGNPGAVDEECTVQDIVRFAWSLRPVFEEAWRVLRPGGWAILQTRDVRMGARLVPVEAVHRSMLESAGFHLYTRYFWRPAFTTLARRRLLAGLTRKFAPLPFDPEVFLVFRKPGPARAGEHSGAECDLLRRDSLSTQSGRQPRRHPHHSPIPVMRALIAAYSMPGDLVIDPFAGAGTVLRLTHALGRRAVGYEIDPDAIAAINANLAESTSP